MVWEGLTEMHKTWIPRNAGLCMQGGGRRVWAPQASARPHACCSLRVEGYTTEIQTLKREGSLTALLPCSGVTRGAWEK